jgi:hypothetical protein
MPEPARSALASDPAPTLTQCDDAHRLVRGVSTGTVESLFPPLGVSLSHSSSGQFP